MFTSLVYTFYIVLVLSLFTGGLGLDTNTNVTERFREAMAAASNILQNFFELYESCTDSTMTNGNFQIDDLQGYLFYPAKTTVGYAPKFTNNRRFFANLIGTSEFHHMLDRDLMEMKRSYVKKLKFCDNIVMDIDMLRDMYDRACEEQTI